MKDQTQVKPLTVFGNFSGYLENVACPICQDPPAPRPIFKKKQGIDILSCPQCGVYYASPRFDEPSLLKIYENEAFTDMSVYDSWSYETWQQGRSRSWINSNLKTQLVKLYLNDGDTILDVGCATGEFVAVARNNDLAAEGIDTSKMLINIGQTVLKVPVQQVDVKDFQPAHKFKAVLIWDVLEHVFNPVEMLERCGEFLEPGGFLFAQVPNLRGISNRLKSFMCRAGLNQKDFGHFGFPFHLYFFDKRSLTRLVNVAGFDAVHFESWSHLLKDGKQGFLADIAIAATKKYCLSDYITIVAQKQK